MKFTRKTYRVARSRAIQALVDAATAVEFDEFHAFAKRVVERGRREKGLWNER